MSLFTTAQSALNALITANTYCSDLTVISEEKGVLANQIALALGTVSTTGGKKAGACIVILQANATLWNPSWRVDANPIASVIVQLNYTLAVFENWAINQGASGSQKPALAIAEAVAGAVTWKRNGLAEIVVPGMLYGRYYLDDDAILWVPDENKSLIVYHVNCHSFARLPIA